MSCKSWPTFKISGIQIHPGHIQWKWNKEIIRLRNAIAEDTLRVVGVADVDEEHGK